MNANANVVCIFICCQYSFFLCLHIGILIPIEYKNTHGDINISRFRHMRNAPFYTFMSTNTHAWRVIMNRILSYESCSNMLVVSRFVIVANNFAQVPIDYLFLQFVSLFRAVCSTVLQARVRHVLLPLNKMNRKLQNLKQTNEWEEIKFNSMRNTMEQFEFLHSIELFNSFEYLNQFTAIGYIAFNVNGFLHLCLVLSFSFSIDGP